jgi:hypothetical protein
MIELSCKNLEKQRQNILMVSKLWQILNFQVMGALVVLVVANKIH